MDWASMACRRCAVIIIWVYGQLEINEAEEPVAKDLSRPPQQQDRPLRTNFSSTHRHGISIKSGHLPMGHRHAIAMTFRSTFYSLHLTFRAEQALFRRHLRVPRALTTSELQRTTSTRRHTSRALATTSTARHGETNRTRKHMRTRRMGSLRPYRTFHQRYRQPT